MKTKWIAITRDNIKTLRPGFRVRFHNGYEWSERMLTDFWISRGFIPTGLQGETAHFLRPLFGNVVYCDFKTSKNTE